ncbi:MAG: hypothetical protein M4D80_08520 [Myxococcota bacterium]|nr:hypothetical protein [Deltaproteobacteria bacterium]MDQ3335192.1 hypothetical protein [Myxococcota bacterium]
MRNLIVCLLIGCGGSTPPPQTPPPSNALPTGQQPPTQTTATGLTQDVCAQKKNDFGPVELREDQVALRRGTGVQRLSDLASTREAPIEVCNPAGQREWLTAVTCAGGEKPTGAQRSGSVGPGGTCGSIVDLYMVGCPEKQYEVFMDMYMCPPGKGF